MPSASWGSKDKWNGGLQEAGWKAGWMQRACKREATRGRKVEGPQGSKAGLGSLVLQRNHRKGWWHHALQPSWDHLHLLEIPRTALSAWIPGHDVSPGVTLQSKVDYGSPLWCHLLTPTKGALGQKPMSPLDSHTGHCVLHVSGTESCLVTVIQVCDASQAQHEDAATGHIPGTGIGREGETGSPVSRSTDERADFLFCLFSWTQFVAKGKNKPDRHLQKALPNEGYVQVAGGRQ